MSRAERSVIVAQDLGELWLALREGSRIVELAVVRKPSESWLGAIFKGRVTGLAPGVRGAFVAAGLERDLFLPDVEGDNEDLVGLAAGDELLVQVTREAGAGKGHRATARVSIPGWALVLAPGADRVGVSRRIEDPAERRRLRELLSELAPDGAGLVARTAAAGRSPDELRRERDGLVARWRQIEASARELRPPALVHREPGPALPFVRDQLSGGLDEVVVDTEELLTEMERLARQELRGARLRVRRHTGPSPAVEAFGLLRALELAAAREVPLPGGGRLVIGHTEALVAIDVNSGTDIDGNGGEETALRTNLQAAAEAVRQIRLRDLAGLIVIDFIDMSATANRARVDAVLADALAGDRSRSRRLPLSEFCLAQISRQRRRHGIPPATSACPTCGHIEPPDTAARARRLLRKLRAVSAGNERSRYRVSAPSEVVARAQEIHDAWAARAGLPGAERIVWGQDEGEGVEPLP